MIGLSPGPGVPAARPLQMGVYSDGKDRAFRLLWLGAIDGYADHSGLDGGFRQRPGTGDLGPQTVVKVSINDVSTQAYDKNKAQYQDVPIPVTNEERHGRLYYSGLVSTGFQQLDKSPPKPRRRAKTTLPKDCCRRRSASSDCDGSATG